MFPERAVAFQTVFFRGQNKAHITGGPGTIGLCSLQEGGLVQPMDPCSPQQCETERAKWEGKQRPVHSSKNPLLARLPVLWGVLILAG